MQLLLRPLPRPLRGSALLTSAAVQNGGVAQWLAAQIGQHWLDIGPGQVNCPLRAQVLT